MCTVVETNSFYVLMILIFTAMVVINGRTHYPEFRILPILHEFRIVSRRLKIKENLAHEQRNVYNTSIALFNLSILLGPMFPSFYTSNPI